MIYLVMAVVWLGVAVAAFLLPRLNPNGPPWTIPNTDISVGWMALVFLVYNLARWWTNRKQQSPDRRYLRLINRPSPPKDEPPDTRFQLRDE